MKFLDFMKTRQPVLLDGAMGTQLDKRGLMSRGGANLEAPDAVQAIHREYAECGCHALITNTLTMNRIYIETHRVGVDVREVNLAGVKLARGAAAGKQYVLGDMCSTGQLLEPYGDYSEEAFCETFKEQAGLLAEGGVDAFIIETMLDLREAVIALRACKENHSEPVIVSMAFATEQKGGRTVMGNSAEECARRLTEEGADMIGANCGDLDPSQTARVVAIYRDASPLPVLGQPNAGKPRLVGDRTVFDMEPGPFAEGVMECVRAGAGLVGGCCGTTPDHIRAVAKALQRPA